MDEFRECAACASKPGMPPLCPSCLHNREVISRLSTNAKTLPEVLQKFAPDLMAELVERHRASVDDFLTLVLSGSERN